MTEDEIPSWIIEGMSWNEIRELLNKCAAMEKEIIRLKKEIDWLTSPIFT